MARIPAELSQPVALGGIVLPDVRAGEVFDLGEAPALGLVILIRHRY